MITYFIAGTDTDIGKTAVTCGLLKMASKAHCRAFAIKPVSCGGMKQGDVFYNEDVRALQRYASITLEETAINPFKLRQPISPHLAARFENKMLTAQGIVDACAPALATNADLCFVEGVGGWLTPINDKETMADVALLLRAPIILVVGMRLGCLNHAMLTYENIRLRGAPFAGWIANQIDPAMKYLEEHIDYLKQKIDGPCMGVIPYLKS